MLSTLIDDWVDIIRTRVTERTADGYQGLLDRYVLPDLGAKLVSEIETRDLQRLYAAMLTQKSLSARVVRHTNAAVLKVFDQESIGS